MRVRPHLLAIVVVALSAPGADAITRTQANARALQLLAPENVTSPTGVIVRGLSKPLKRGTEVFERGEPVVPSAVAFNLAAKAKAKAEHKKFRRWRPVRQYGFPALKKRTWLFWMDPQPGARFSHPTTLLLIDDESGMVTGRRELSYWPLVNGRKPALRQVYSSLPAVQRGATSTRIPLFGPEDVKAPKDSLVGECMITIGLRKDKDFKADFPGMEGLGQTLADAGTGFKVFAAGTTTGNKKLDAPDGYDLFTNVGYAIRNEACKNILLYIDGHGTAPGKGPTRVNVGEKWVKNGRQNAKGEDLYDLHPAYVTAADIKNILDRYKPTTFKLKIDACYSGRFKDEISQKKYPNVHILEASSASDEVSWSYLPTVTKDDGTVVPNNTENPGNTGAPGRGEFTNGNIASLQRFFYTQDLIDRAQAQGGNLFVTALTYAAYTSNGNDFAAQQGLTHPTFYSDQGPLGGGAPPGGGAPTGSRTTGGSNLQAGATVAQRTAADRVIYGTTFTGSTPFAVRQVETRDGAIAADGQILAVRVKGTAVASADPAAPAPLTEIHFSSVRPQGDGSVKVMVTSQAFNLPGGGDPNQVTTYVPENFCVAAGDYLVLSTQGGFEPTFYPDGVDYRVFGDVAGAQISSYSEYDGVGNGAQFTPAGQAGVELLMQWDLGTGDQATALCPGGTKS